MPSYVVQSCCLTWHSSCKVSLFTFWNLSQVVILKLERCGFMFFGSLFYLPYFSVVNFINSKIFAFVRAAKLLTNFKWLSCKVSFYTLWNASEVTILKLERCGFLHSVIYLVFHYSLLFIFFFNSKILRSICGLFSIFFEIFKKYIFQFFLNNKELWRY